VNKYIAVLGRQPQISLAELEALFNHVRPIAPALAEFESAETPDIRRLGGTLKIAEPIKLDLFLKNLPANGKITLGISDFSPKTSPYLAQGEALKLKRRLAKAGRSVRVIPNKTAMLSNATSLHNHLFTETKIELLKYRQNFYRVIQLSNIEDYAQRDQKRPARDAKVGMLPPKLAQILINLCGNLPKDARILDPFCGTGVLLQEVVLMGYTPYGTDLSERMVEYTQRNLEWLSETGRNLTFSKLFATNEEQPKCRPTHDDGIGQTGFEKLNIPPSSRKPLQISQGDATNFHWNPPIDAVACETYLGPPMSNPPAEIKLRTAKQECKAIILGFLKNLAPQIKTGTPVVIAVPAWLRPDGHYERLLNIDELQNLCYNVSSFKNLEQNDLLYHRAGQVVAREIIVLRKK